MRNKKIKLGFSTGALFGQLKAKEAILLIKNLGCKFIELGFLRIDEFSSGQLENISASDLSGFEYVSFHAPKFEYANDNKTKKILERISRFHRMRNLDLVVFHPHHVQDFAVFDNARFNVGFENMANKQGTYKSAGEMEKILSKNEKFKFILDINHCYANDPSLKLAEDFYKRLGNKTAQIHLSGWREFHEPLFETKQVDIIQAIKKFNIPIIVESVLSPETIAKEKDYILSNL